MCMHSSFKHVTIVHKNTRRCNSNTRWCLNLSLREFVRCRNGSKVRMANKINVTMCSRFCQMSRLLRAIQNDANAHCINTHQNITNSHTHTWCIVCNIRHEVNIRNCIMHNTCRTTSTCTDGTCGQQFQSHSHSSIHQCEV